MLPAASEANFDRKAEQMSRLTALRRWARPLVFRARLAARAVGRVLRPPVPWNGQHHPILERFAPWSGQADGKNVHDFLGIKTDASFRPTFKADPAGALQTSYPPPHAGYFELVFVLESVVAGAGREPFTMMELGAGYGPWMVTTHQAMGLVDAGTPVQLVGVEMVPHHVAWLKQHFLANGIDPGDHTLIQAATSDRTGEGHFVPEIDLGWDFGQQLRDSEPRRDTGALQPVTVKTVTLDELLADTERVNLLHIDIQGQEARVLEHAIDAVDRKVERLIVATHSRSIHRHLRRLLRDHGWTNVYDFGFRKRERTEFGDVQFLDGLLAWVRR